MAISDRHIGIILDPDAFDTAQIIAILRGAAPPVMCVNSTDLAEIVPRCIGVPLIQSQMVLTGHQISGGR